MRHDWLIVLPMETVRRNMQAGKWSWRTSERGARELVGFNSCRAMQLLARFALDARPLPTSDLNKSLTFVV